MRRLLAGLALLACMAANAQEAPLPPFQPIGAPSKLAVTGTAQSLTLPTALSGSTGKVQYLVYVSGTQEVDFRCDGTVATTVNGWQVGANTGYVITLPASVTTCSVIAATTGSTVSFTAGLGSSFAMSTTGAGAAANQVQGPAADGTTAVGNPVQVGGVDSSGNVQALLTDTNGNASIRIMAQGVTGADGMANTSGTALLRNLGDSGNLLLVAGEYLFNGTSWDRKYSALSAVELASGARTTTQTGSDHTNFNGRGVKVLVNVTSAGTGSITPSIQIKDANGIYYTVLTGTAITTNTTQVLTIYPGITAAANVSISDILTRTFRVVITANNANSVTYSVGYEIIL